MNEPATVPPVVPEYASASPRSRPLNIWLYRVAVFSAGFPLVVGILVLLLYWLLRLDALPILGFLTILTGMGMAGLSTLLLAIFSWQLWTNGRPTFIAWRRRLILAVLLLTVNVPAVFLCAAVGQRLMSTGHVTVHNTGSSRVDSFVIDWPGGSKDIGPIEPGRSVKGAFVVDREGSITFRQTRGASVTTGELVDYLTIGPDAVPELKVVSSDAVVLLNGSPADPIDPDE